MDEELTLHELTRLEADRKLKSLPTAVLETAWVREAQVEAVIDAVLVVALSNTQAIARARHAGEWCARIAGALPCGPDPAFARRVGALSEVDPAALERIPELRHLAPYVRDYQAYAIEGGGNPRAMSLVTCVAREFDERITLDEDGRAPSPQAVLGMMIAHADEITRPIVEALQTAVHPVSHVRVA
ncbi:MAG TPA: hypothetical protein VMF11_02100 [Candidatus Baltobacteraceae bacterium]|nr:hypothetical protein [Candidatus Baltobacteraceae bacterium]